MLSIPQYFNLSDLYLYLSELVMLATLQCMSLSTHATEKVFPFHSLCIMVCVVHYLLYFHH